MLEVRIASHLSTTDHLNLKNTPFKELEKSLDHFLTSPSLPYQVEEYLLFLRKGNLVGYSYLEGEKDLKNMRGLYEVDATVSMEEETEVVEKSTLYALHDLAMVDFSFNLNGKMEPFLRAAANQNFDFLVDNDMIVYSKELPFEKEDNKQY